MNVLQIEDSEQYKLDDVQVVETLEGAKELLELDNFDTIVIDGKFPLNKGDKPDINVQPTVEYLKRFDAKIIVWTNSIRAQKYCEDNNISCFSKKNKTGEHIEKMKKYGLKEYAEVRDKGDILK